jgi:hypothetical protein
VKKLLLAAVLLGLIFAVLLGALSYSRTDNASSKMPVNGAFRDGLYQAKLDAQPGRTPRFMTGRWSSDADRTAFLAGYRQGLGRRESIGTFPNGHQLIGYRDGIVAGAQARRSEQPFALRAKLIRAGQIQSATGRDKQLQYLQGYANGYQYGYYSGEENLQSENNARALNRF